MTHNRNYERKNINYLLNFLVIGSMFRMWWAQKITFFYLQHWLAASWNPLLFLCLCYAFRYLPYIIELSCSKIL